MKNESRKVHNARKEPDPWEQLGYPDWDCNNVQEAHERILDLERTVERQGKMLEALIVAFATNEQVNYTACIHPEVNIDPNITVTEEPFVAAECLECTGNILVFRPKPTQKSFNADEFAQSVVGKYVAVEDEEGEGAAGWVESISEKKTIGGTEGRYINFDWGMSMFTGPGDTIEEIEPPEDEKDGPNPEGLCHCGIGTERECKTKPFGCNPAAACNDPNCVQHHSPF